MLIDVVYKSFEKIFLKYVDSYFLGKNLYCFINCLQKMFEFVSMVIGNKEVKVVK